MFHYQAGEAAGPGGGEGGGGHYAPAQAEASRPVGEGQHELAAQDSLFRQVDSKTVIQLVKTASLVS